VEATIAEGEKKRYPQGVVFATDANQMRIHACLSTL